MDVLRLLVKILAFIEMKLWFITVKAVKTITGIACYSITLPQRSQLPF